MAAPLNLKPRDRARLLALLGAVCAFAATVLKSAALAIMGALAGVMALRWWYRGTDADDET